VSEESAASMDGGLRGLLQIASPLAKGQIHEICAGTLEHIEDQKDRRALDCRLPTAPRTHSQPALQSAKVRLPMHALRREWSGSVQTGERALSVQ
jgi:hypothetical protein